MTHGQMQAVCCVGSKQCIVCSQGLCVPCGSTCSRLLRGEQKQVEALRQSQPLPGPRPFLYAMQTSSHTRAWRLQAKSNAACSLLQIGDASATQSPLSFGGFGAMMRHLGRLTRACEDALRCGTLSQEDLAAIHPYQPSLSSSWLFQRCVQAPLRLGSRCGCCRCGCSRCGCFQCGCSRCVCSWCGCPWRGYSRCGCSCIRPALVALPAGGVQDGASIFSVGLFLHLSCCGCSSGGS